MYPGTTIVFPVFSGTSILAGIGRWLWGFGKVLAGAAVGGLHVHEGVAPATFDRVMTLRLLLPRFNFSELHGLDGVQCPDEFG